MDGQQGANVKPRAVRPPNYQRLLDYISPKSTISDETKAEFQKLLESYGKEQFNIQNEVLLRQRYEVLRTAALRGRTQVVEILSWYGWKDWIDARSESGKTALHEAAYNGHIDVVDLLLKYGADPKLETFWRKESTMHRALCRVKFKQEPVGVNQSVEALLAKGASANSMNSVGATPLHYAAMNAHDKPLEILLRSGGGSMLEDREGNTPLHLAAYMGHANIVELLLHDPHLKIDEPNRFGKTPLYLTVFNYETSSDTKPVSLKIDEDADRGVQSQWASYEDTLEVLLSHGADIRLPLRTGRLKAESVLDWAANNTSSNTLAMRIFREAHLHDQLLPPTPEPPAESGSVREPSASQLEACSHFKGHVVHYWSSPKDGKHFAGPFTENVADILREPNKALAGDAAAEPSFSWYHLPCNIFQWVEAVHRGLYYDLNRNASATSPSLFQSWMDESEDDQYSGSSIMGPQCRYDDQSTSFSGIERMFISMPYLSLETHRGHVEYQCAMKGNVFPKPTAFPGSNIHAYNDLRKTWDYKPRRTLDQYFYQHLRSTVERDKSQVTLRASQPGAILSESNDRFRRQWWPSLDKKRAMAYDYTAYEDDGTIVMVDHLWLWILGEDTVITCLPNAWGGDAASNLSPIASTLQKMQSTKLHSAQDLALLIMSEVSMAHARAVTPDKALLTCFSRIIDETADLQVGQFKDFIKASSSLGDMTACKTPSERESFDKNMKSLGQIVSEIKNLCKVTDILDELHIIKEVLVEQSTVVETFTESLTRARTNTEQLKWEFLRLKQKHTLLNRRIRSGQGQTDILLRRAQLTHGDILQLLDLKQKQATITESRFARQQAEDTAKQGDTVLVFTFVTILFLPASFMAAFFAIPNVEIPGVGVGGIGFVIGIIIGVTIFLSGPLTYLALNIDRVRYWMEMRRAKRAATAEEARPEKSILAGHGTTTSYRDLRARLRGGEMEKKDDVNVEIGQR